MSLLKEHYDTSDRTTLNDPPFKDDGHSKTTTSKQIVGFIIYFILVIVAIPFLLIKFGHSSILQAYMPNVDMVATVLGFQSKEQDFKEFTSYFHYLYNPATGSLYGYWSQLIINYFALLGATYYMCYYTLKTKSLSKGWGRAFIMLLVTYLLPGNYIVYYMEKLHSYLDKSDMNKLIKHIFIYGAGFGVSILFILLEDFLITHLGDSIAKTLRNVLQIS